MQNKLLLTEKGEQLRRELQQERQPAMNEISEIKSDFISQPQPRFDKSNILQLLNQKSNEDVLNKRSLSDIAISKLHQKASLLLDNQQDKLKKEILKDLTLPALQRPSELAEQSKYRLNVFSNPHKPKFDYVETQAQTLIRNISQSKERKCIHYYFPADSQTRKRLILKKKLNSLEKSTLRAQESFQNQTTVVEENEKTNRIKDILNMENILEKIISHHKNKVLKDQFYESKLKQDHQKYTDLKNKDFLGKPMSPNVLKEQARQQLEDIYDNRDCEERKHVRFQYLQKDFSKKYWSKYHVPQQTNRWNQRISEAKSRLQKVNQ